MIHLTCTNCQASLEIDDAFAGGVCRCQHCGTIQTVPAHLKGNASAPVAAGAAATVTGATTTPKPHQQKSLYQNQRHAKEQQQQAAVRGAATGLHELSDAVASSGLGRGSLRKHGAAAPPTTPPAMASSAAAAVDYATPPQQKKSATIWIVAAALGAGLLLLVMLGYLFVGRSTVVVTTTLPTVTATGSTGTPVTTPPADGDVIVPTTPHFCGVDLSAATGVVYLLDRGSASGELLDTLKAATYASLHSLGERRKFAVVFWQAGNDPIVTFPQQGVVDASAGNIADAAKAFEDVVAQGRSDPAPAIENAAGRNPSDVVFVTAKGDDLGDELVQQIAQAFPGKRVHAFAIGEDYGTALKAIAKQQNGTYRLLNKRQLDAYSRPK